MFYALYCTKLRIISLSEMRSGAFVWLVMILVCGWGIKFLKLVLGWKGEIWYDANKIDPVCVNLTQREKKRREYER